MEREIVDKIITTESTLQKKLGSKEMQLKMVQEKAAQKAEQRVE